MLFSPSCQLNNSPALSHTTLLLALLQPPIMLCEINSFCEKNENYPGLEKTNFQVFLIYHRGNREGEHKERKCPFF